MCVWGGGGVRGRDGPLTQCTRKNRDREYDHEKAYFIRSFKLVLTGNRLEDQFPVLDQN